jgi:hypothetical protein
MKKFFKEFSDFQIKILIKYTNQDFEKGYEKLKQIHSDQNILWKNDIGFQACVLDLFDKKEKYTVFFVDDIIFKEPFTIQNERFKYFQEHGDIAAFSLRLHPRLTYCYSAAVKMTPPEFTENGVFFWRGLAGDYGYPMSLDGHIFRSSDIFYNLVIERYDGPNLLESQMAMRPILKPKLICLDKSVIVNNPVNKVQNFNNNIHGNITAEYLNEQFLNNKIIDLASFEGFENISCHQEIPVNFINI